ncbi:hypothetical protein BOSEA31B_14990 [Hyphomicrobiales bacterium]|nr:hypothetical protein BOSEA31B_14990 [Hyphomicrobiales bacterium]CAH1701476.1 hypothetical protein BOSEA1005_21175 [Hyphomicrobiales bacterium]CAI0345433.1 hypothetical protein BO1005MUT1_390105 [Hyphomicrobiales bacterium]
MRDAAARGEIGKAECAGFAEPLQIAPEQGMRRRRVVFAGHGNDPHSAMRTACRGVAGPAFHAPRSQDERRRRMAPP